MRNRNTVKRYGYYGLYKRQELTGKTLIYDELINSFPTGILNCNCADDLLPYHISKNVKYIQPKTLIKSKKKFKSAIFFRLQFCKRKNIEIDLKHKEAIYFLRLMMKACCNLTK